MDKSTYGELRHATSNRIFSVYFASLSVDSLRGLKPKRMVKPNGCPIAGANFEDDSFRTNSVETRKRGRQQCSAETLAAMFRQYADILDHS